MKTSLLPLLMSCLLGCDALTEQKPALETRSMALQCADRKIEIQAQCYQEEGIPGLSCTSQQLSVSGEGVARPLATRSFKQLPLQTGDAYPVVEEKIGALVCTETPDRQKYIVTRVSNGGSCARCEWAEVYDWNGVYLGSDRDPKKNKVVSAAVAAAFDAKAKKVAAADGATLYSGSKRRGN